MKENEYTQLMVLEGIMLNDRGEDPTKEEIIAFLKYLNTEMPGAKFKYYCEGTTLPDKDIHGEIIPNTGGRIDQFFYIHKDDIEKIAEKRLSMGIRWWEDILGNGYAHRYPREFLEKHMPTWNGDEIRKTNPGYEDLFANVV